MRFDHGRHRARWVLLLVVGIAPSVPADATVGERFPSPADSPISVASTVNTDKTKRRGLVVCGLRGGE